MKRIGNAFKGVLGGLVLIVIGVILLWWNEGNNVKNIKTTDEMKASYVDVTSEMIDSTNEGMINGLHSALGEDQGIVELDKGKTYDRHEYAYTIVKNKLGPKGTQYLLTFHILKDNVVYNVQGFFNEKGAFGSREGVVMTKLAGENKINISTMDGWKVDPYNVNYKKGYLMNLSEKKDYDEMFPNHPLSEARKVLEYLIDEN